MLFLESLQKIRLNRTPNLQSEVYPRLLRRRALMDGEGLDKEHYFSCRRLIPLLHDANHSTRFAKLKITTGSLAVLKFFVSLQRIKVLSHKKTCDTCFISPELSKLIYSQY